MARIGRQAVFHNEGEKVTFRVTALSDGMATGRVTTPRGGYVLGERVRVPLEYLL